MNNKAIWGVIALIVIIVFVIGAVNNWKINFLPQLRKTVDTNINQNASTTLSTYTDQKTGISFQYPSNLSMKYAEVIDWPPSLSTFTPPLACKTATTTTSGLPGKTEARVIGGSAYCVSTQVEGAAGSIYTQYQYQTVAKGQGITYSFSVRTPQCLNYEEPAQSECKQEQASFDPDALIGNITKTLVTH